MKYEIALRKQIEITVTVEAENESNAEEKALEMELDRYATSIDSDNWEVIEIQEIE